MLSCAYLGIGIPLFWMVLDRAGNSSKKDRIHLLERALERFGIEKIEALLADREFIGEPWFCFLISNKIPFIIRVKQGFMAGGICKGCHVPIKTLIKTIDYRKRKMVNYPITLWGLPLYVSIHCSKKSKEPMIVVSNLLFENPIALYRRRWEIETLFSCLKTRGFCMQDTHMTEGEKIEKLIFLLAIAFCWAYKIGSLKAKEEPIALKKHGRKTKSLFRKGLDLIRRSLFSLVRNFSQFMSVLSCFSSIQTIRSSM